MNKKAIRVGPWVQVDGHCAARVVEGGDPNAVADRVAFIEKTPRVRVGPWTNSRDDYLNWHSGSKGDGSDDHDSRTWCDMQLAARGYELVDS